MEYRKKPNDIDYESREEFSFCNWCKFHKYNQWNYYHKCHNRSVVRDPQNVDGYHHCSSANPKGECNNYKSTVFTRFLRIFGGRKKVYRESA